jgi:CopG family transcriptional regulator/antitoxin EndoAI
MHPVNHVNPVQPRSLNISLPPEMYAEVEQVAREESRTKSELMREAFRQYRFSRQWNLLRRWGEDTAARLGITSDDDVEWANPPGHWPATEGPLCGAQLRGVGRGRICPDST